MAPTLQQLERELATLWPMYEALKVENAALRAELAEEARLNGMGAEREAALLGKVERLGAELAEANRVAEFNFAQYQDAGRLLAEVCEYCECERKPSN